MAIKSTKLGPGTLTIGAEANLMTFSSQTRSCKLTPSVDTEDSFYVLSGEQQEGDRTESWALTGTFVQDFGATESTTEWLFTHRGERHPFIFIPSTAAGRRVSGELIVEAIDIGGDVMTRPTSDFEFTVFGPDIGTVAGATGTGMGTFDVSGDGSSDELDDLRV